MIIGEGAGEEAAARYLGLLGLQEEGHRMCHQGTGARGLGFPDRRSGSYLFFPIMQEGSVTLVVISAMVGWLAGGGCCLVSGAGCGWGEM